MDYKKKYEEALEKAKLFNKRWQCIEATDSELALRELKEIFPELKESEDERIRKEFICFIETEVPQCKARDKYIAWLEKQGEKQESINIDIDKMINEYANNNEPDNELFGKPINCMIRAYKQGLKDAIRKFALKP